MTGCPAATIGSDGRLLAANQEFERVLESRAVDPHGRLRFLDADTDKRFRGAMQIGNTQAASASIVISGHHDDRPCVIHVLPLRRSAWEVFGSNGFVLIVADGRNNMVPSADLLRLMFDLTGREATLARQLVEGRTMAAAAKAMKISVATAKVHLRHIFEKTGCRRQADLVGLIIGYTAPSHADQHA